MIILGLLPFDADIAGLVQAMGSPLNNGAAAGAGSLPPEVTRSLLGSLSLHHNGARGTFPDSAKTVRLTQRERQVCDRIAEGLSNKQIASRLGIAIHTVKCHVHNILEKLGLDSRVQVAVFGRASTLVST